MYPKEIEIQTMELVVKLDKTSYMGGTLCIGYYQQLGCP